MPGAEVKREKTLGEKWEAAMAAFARLDRARCAQSSGDIELYAWVVAFPDPEPADPPNIIRSEN